ncbi:MAG: hypothetical protein JWP75_797 [Frondihabitans sp.]|nr:hypothetical protein [Frondihabitans sp.]
MNPLRGAAWRARTFLSEPVHELERRTVEAEAAASAATGERLDEVLQLLRASQTERETSDRESRRLFVALRTLLEEQSAEITELRREIERLRAGESTPAS